MSILPPDIDKRNQERLVEQLRTYVVRYMPEWANELDVNDLSKTENDVHLNTFVQIFARLMELLNQRLNDAPDKNFIAFLQMLGMNLRPPSSARAPLVFTALETASGSVTVPAGTQVAVQDTADDPIIFETEEALSVITPKLVRTYSLEAARDRYTDHSSLFETDRKVAETLLEGKTVLPHKLYIAHNELFAFSEPVDIELSLELKERLLPSESAWSVNWYCYEEGAETARLLTPVAKDETEGNQRAVLDLMKSGTVRFEGIESVGAKELSQYTRKSVSEGDWSRVSANNHWIFAQLETPLPMNSYENTLPESPGVLLRKSSDETEHFDVAGTIRPFGTIPKTGDEFYIASETLFSRTGSTIVINLQLDTAFPAPPGVLTSITAQYFSTELNRWVELGLTQNSGAEDYAAFFLDDTGAFNASGEIRFQCPLMGVTGLFGVESRWIKFILTGGVYHNGTEYRAPAFLPVTLWSVAVPEISRIEAKTIIQPEERFPGGRVPALEDYVDPDGINFSANELVLSSPFAPLGANPSAAPFFYLASEEHLSQAGSTLILNCSLSSPAPGGAAIALRWDYYDGVEWKLLGKTNQNGELSGSEVGFKLKDGTNSFTHNGIIKFICPHILPLLIGTRETRWLRVSMESGTYVPTMSSIKMTHVARIYGEEPVELENGAFGGVTLDISRDFYPFGDAPAFNDVFYFSAPEAFAKKEAIISMQIGLSPGVAVPDTENILLTWEYYNGKTWKILGTSGKSGVINGGAYGFTDGSRAFTVRPEYADEELPRIEFRCPETATVVVNGVESYWMRVRITGGDYGLPASFSGGTTNEYTEASYRPPSIEYFLVEYRFEKSDVPQNVLLENDFFYDDKSEIITANYSAEANALKYVQPFRESYENLNGLYLGFDSDINNTPVNVFFPLIASPFNVPFQETASTSPDLAWEYWNGVVWEELPVNDLTENLTQTEIVRLLLPDDASSRPLFGEERAWVRLRLEQGAYVLNPQIDTIYTNIVWANQLVTIKDEILGSSNGEPDQSFVLSYVPVLSGQKILVQEKALTEEDRRISIEEEGADAITEIKDETGNVQETWVRWHEVNHFTFSAPENRHYTIDNDTGTILFGDGIRGYIPPAGIDNIKAETYQQGGGVRGNVGAELITDLHTALEDIDSVSNPIAVSGGVDRESVDNLRGRGPQVIKNRNRAVTYEDFEWLVREATGEIARIKCLPTTNAEFKFAPGFVTLIIVPDSTDVKPFPSQALIQSVESYLKEKASTYLAAATPVQINVIGPGFLRVYADVTVKYENLNEAKIVEARIREALNEFFNPLRGGPYREGWEFGRNVHITEVYQTIENVSGVDFVENVTLRASEQLFKMSLREEETPRLPYKAGAPALLRRRSGTPGNFTYKDMTLRLSEELKEDETITEIILQGFKEGDLIKISSADGNNELQAIVTSVSDGLLQIESVFNAREFAVGSLVERLDGSVRSLLKEVLVGNTDVGALVVEIPEEEDLLELKPSDLSLNFIENNIKSVSNIVETVYVDINYLVYAGNHVIRVLQEEA